MRKAAALLWSVRLRAALAAAITAGLAFGVGAAWLRDVLYTAQLQASIDQARTEAVNLSYLDQLPVNDNPPIGPRGVLLMPDRPPGRLPGGVMIRPGVQRPVMLTDSGEVLLLVNGDLWPFFSDAGLTLNREPAGDRQITTTEVRLGRLKEGWQPSPLESRTVTVVSVDAPELTVGKLGLVPASVPGHDFANDLANGPLIGLDTPVTVVAVASPLAAEAVVAAVDTGLLLGLPPAVLLVALIAWIATGRALRPVEAIRSQLTHISTDALDRRVPVPRSRDEIHRLAVTTNTTLDRLERAVDRQRRFVSDAAHELRSPLTVLRNRLEVTLRHPAGADWSAVVRGALSDAERIQALTDDLLLLARAEHTTRPDQRVDLAAIVEEQIAERAYRVGDGPRFESRIAGPALVAGEEQQLSRLLRNLLDNAARHAELAVTVTVEATPAEVRVEVLDDGPGIPAAARERVFERFTRLDDARARDTGGAGLGLAIAREIAAWHGGTVEVADSELGARLLVRLPAATAAP